MQKTSKKTDNLFKNRSYATEQRELTREEIQKSNKPLKGCSTSSAIKRTQTKSILRVLLTPVRMSIIKKTKAPGPVVVAAHASIPSMGRLSSLVSLVYNASFRRAKDTDTQRTPPLQKKKQVITNAGEVVGKGEL